MAIHELPELRMYSFCFHAGAETHPAPPYFHFHFHFHVVLVFLFRWDKKAVSVPITGPFCYKCLFFDVLFIDRVLTRRAGMFLPHPILFYCSFTWRNEETSNSYSLQRQVCQSFDSIEQVQKAGRIPTMDMCWGKTRLWTLPILGFQEKNQGIGRLQKGQRLCLKMELLKRYSYSRCLYWLRLLFPKSTFPIAADHNGGERSENINHWYTPLVIEYLLFNPLLPLHNHIFISPLYAEPDLTLQVSSSLHPPPPSYIGYPLILFYLLTLFLFNFIYQCLISSHCKSRLNLSRWLLVSAL